MTIETQKNSIQSYIRAKDDNKPHLMKVAFTDSATLEMKVKTDNISFPAETIGLDAMSNVLVRNFSQTFENVYTFCLSDSFVSQGNVLSCDWLVCMSERDGGKVRVGAGKYDWHFQDEENRTANINGIVSTLATKLVITIEQMLILSPDHSDQIMEWAGKLPYPFSDSEQMIEYIPDLESLDMITEFLNKKYS